MKAWLKHALFLIVMVVPLNSPGQAPYFHSHKIGQLSENEKINCLIQGQDQYIVLGTSRGILVFDGFEYTRVPSAADDQEITAIFENGEGVRWYGTANGVLLQQSGDSALPVGLFQDQKNESPITDIVKDGSGDLWVATYGNGIFRINNDSVYHLSSSLLPDTYIYTLIADRKGNILAGSDAGIQVIGKDSDGDLGISSITSADGLPDNIVRSLAQGKDGSVWVGTHSRGIARLNPETKEFTIPAIASDWRYGTVTALLPMDQEIWIGTVRSGIINLGIGKEESLQQYDPRNGFTDDQMNQMLYDNEGNIWIANNSNLLYRTNKRFTFIREHEEVSFKGILAITGDHMGNIWFSNEQGLFRHNIVFNGNHKMEQPLAGTEFNTYTIISLMEDNAGNMWAGTFDRGAIRIDPMSGNTMVFDSTNGLSDNNVIAFGKDKNSIWLATLGGVVRLIPQGEEKYRMENYTKRDGLGNNYIFDILSDRRGRVWFATDGSGLSVFENGKFTNFSAQMDSASQVVYSMAVDDRGVVWFSTPNNGLYTFDGNAFNHFNPRNSTLNRRSLGLTTDMHGHIINVSPDGIDVITPDHDQVISYGQAYGVGTIDPQLKAITSDFSGNIWIGGKSQTIHIDQSMVTSTRRPVTRFRGFELLLQPIAGEKLRKLAHNENHLTFKFTGLWYQNPGSVNYRYMLDGYDRDWIHTGDRRVTYSSLPPGEYTFRVQSSHTSDFDQAGEEHIRVVINPPFWATGWFIALVVITLVGSLLYIIREREIRLNKFERDQREKLAFQLETLQNQVNPHFLFNSFNTLLHLIDEDKTRSKKYVENLSQFFRDILSYRDKNLIPLQEEITLSENYLYLQKQRYQDNLHIRFTIPEEYLKHHIPPLTIQLLLENALKHNMATRKSPLEIEVEGANGYLRVTNNLQIKSVADPGTGVGLENIKKRFSLLTGLPVQIEKTDTAFSVAVPLIKPE